MLWVGISMMLETQNFIKIAKRENNKKRNYLVVNALQGKHIPVKPSEAFFMFEKLAFKVKEHYQNENILFIGFAETATAIGAAVASSYAAMYENAQNTNIQQISMHPIYARCNSIFYMHTTRETLENVKYIYFSEQHSHATEQRLVRDDIEQIKDKIDRIVFVEDEVTTGNTILNIIDILNKMYPQIKRYAVASLLNGMNDEAIHLYRQREIDLNYIVKTNHENYGQIAEHFAGDGKYFTLEQLKLVNNIQYKTIHTNDYMDSRRIIAIKEYHKNIEKLFWDIEKKVHFKEYKNVLVIGTEEFMYPALVVAQNIEKIGLRVRFHATTRSPIIVSSEERYPLHTRYELESLYDKKRKTFIYDLDRYDCVLVITDAANAKMEGLDTLLAALHISGNEKIYVIQWI